MMGRNIYIYHLIMSTAPKLTYAKIGNKSKNKVESNSTEMIRHKQQQSQDLFSHMNQDNLNYIKKQLKLKKNRSEHDKTKLNKDEEKEELQDQITQREKIYHKYKGEEQVSQREPYLEETERKSSEEKPLEIQLSEEAEEENQDYHPSQKKMLSISQKDQHKTFTKNPENHKMYQSLPYEEPKKRVVSIQGYFRESVSTNLQKFKQDGTNFIEFLEDYISDLNHSKHLKSKTHEQSSLQKKNIDKTTKFNKQNLKKSTRRDQSEEEEKLKQNIRNIERFKRNSDTFGEPNSKYTVHSSLSYDAMELQVKLKKEQLSCIMLAKEIESLRQALGERDQVIKKLKLNNELLQEQITHLKTQQEIILKSKDDFGYQSKPNKSQKQTRRTNDQHVEDYDDSTFNKFILSHHRHGSVNPTINNSRNGYSQRGARHNLRQQDLGEYNQPLFHQFAPPQQPTKYRERQSTPRKNNKSIQKIQREYEQFMHQSNFLRKQDNKYR